MDGLACVVGKEQRGVLFGVGGELIQDLFEMLLGLPAARQAGLGAALFQSVKDAH